MLYYGAFPPLSCLWAGRTKKRVELSPNPSQATLFILTTAGVDITPARVDVTTTGINHIITALGAGLFPCPFCFLFFFFLGVFVGCHNDHLPLFGQARKLSNLPGFVQSVAK